MSEKCYLKVKNNGVEELKEVEFVGVYQQSQVIKALLGGHSGGVDAYPVAVIKCDGRLMDVELNEVIFKEQESKSGVTIIQLLDGEQYDISDYGLIRRT